MATRLQVLAEAFPDHIEAISRNVTGCDILPNWLDGEAKGATAATLLGEAFLWYRSPEGHDYWSSLYHRSEE